MTIYPAIPAAHRCERCDLRQAWFHVDVLGYLIHSCADCLTPSEKRDIDEARREAEYNKLHPRDVVEAEGGNI